MSITIDKILKTPLMHKHKGTDIVGNVTATPGGSDTQVQFNDHSVLGGASTFTYDKLTGDIKIKAGYKLILDD